MDIRCFFGLPKNPRKSVFLVLEKKPRKKYEHTPKWFKKKMLQELSLTLEHLNKEERNILKCVRCECYWICRPI